MEKNHKAYLSFVMKNALVEWQACDKWRKSVHFLLFYSSACVPPKRDRNLSI